MDLLKKIFPLSFKFSDTVANLIVCILVYVVAGAVGGVVFSVLDNIPLIGFTFTLLGSLLSIYCTAGIVILILAFTNVLK